MDVAFVLPCCVEGPAHFIPKAQYALRMLLLPLGIAPNWVAEASLPAGGIYYGVHPEKIPAGILNLPLHEATCRFFEEKAAFDAHRVTWRTAAGARYPVLFGGPEPAVDDLVASTFFWLSGWQEYTIINRDQHGRFPFETSIQAVLGTVLEPLVDVYREVLARQLLQLGTPIRHRQWGDKTWAFCPTHDIDYLRKWRPGMIYREVVERFITNTAEETTGMRFSRLGTFIRDFIRPGPDVFRKSFVRMIEETDQRGGKATYFIKTDAHGPQDVYYSPRHRFLKRMFGVLKEKSFEIGLHPSYFAHNHPVYLKKEKALLEAVAGVSVSAVRQHFLRYDVPQTGRYQAEAGFKIDSTLAFAEQEGFRNATCHPFLRFDVDRNEMSAVWEMPLCIMDGTLFNRRGLDGAGAIAVTKNLIQICKKYNGVCVALWHNTLWDEMDFSGWGAHFLQTMDYAVEQAGQIDSLSGVLGAYLGNLK